MKDTTTRTAVALIGLGSIGVGMAGCLARASDVDLTVFNRSAQRYDDVRGLDLAIAPELTSAVRGADIVVLSLTDDVAVRDVVNEVRGALKQGAVVVDTSTVAASTAQELEAMLAQRGVEFVDSPVTGGAEAALRGTLTLLCGGSDDALAAARPVLERVAARVVHIGGSGQGQVAKAVNQVMLAGSLLGVAEGIALARRCGVDAHALVDALQEGAAASWVLRERAHYMIDGDFAPRGRIALHHKDLLLALALAEQRDISLPLTALVAEVEGRLIADGDGDGDVAVIVRGAEQQR